MNKLNINAVVFWVFLSISFHLLGWNWLLGLAIGLGISCLAALIK
jgi:hypothetical protein